MVLKFNKLCKMVLWSGLISFIHALGEITNGLIVAVSGSCICQCPISTIDRFHVKNI